MTSRVSAGNVLSGLDNLELRYSHCRSFPRLVFLYICFGLRPSIPWETISCWWKGRNLTKEDSCSAFPECLFLCGYFQSLLRFSFGTSSVWPPLRKKKRLTKHSNNKDYCTCSLQDVHDDIENEFLIFTRYMRRSILNSLNIFLTLAQHGRIQARV